jgi:hypothetical protein
MTLARLIKKMTVLPLPIFPTCFGQGLVGKASSSSMVIVLNEFNASTHFFCLNYLVTCFFVFLFKISVLVMSLIVFASVLFF